MVVACSADRQQQALLVAKARQAYADALYRAPGSVHRGVIMATTMAAEDNGHDRCGEEHDSNELSAAVAPAMTTFPLVGLLHGMAKRGQRQYCSHFPGLEELLIMLVNFLQS